jgi:arylsulfatase A-like enzyme
MRPVPVLPTAAPLLLSLACGRGGSWPAAPPMPSPSASTAPPAADLGPPNKGRPFFVYLAHRDPHAPYSPAPEFAGRSAAGAYGDVIQGLDATVGDFMKALKDEGLDLNTLVVFTSDNGAVVPPKGPGSVPGGCSASR